MWRRGGPAAVGGDVGIQPAGGGRWGGGASGGGRPSAGMVPRDRSTAEKVGEEYQPAGALSRGIGENGKKNQISPKMTGESVEIQQYLLLKG